MIGDSWFASVKTATQLYEHGLFFIGMVKTAHRNFPMKQIKARCPKDRGEYVYAVTDENPMLLGMGWRDRKIHCLVSTCDITSEGLSVLKKRRDENGNVFSKTVKRPQLFEVYYDGSAATDIHNHMR